MSENFIDKVYEARDASSTRDLYDAWSASYDADVGAHGYATPDRCAEALAGRMEDLSAPILDFGCGTGLSGAALARAGFETIDGMDLSADMLAQANDKGVYRKLIHIDAGEEFAHAPGDYAAIAAIGVIGAGAAPISVFDQIMHALPKGGFLVFSFNDHALAEPENEARVNEWLDCGAATLLFKEHGDHLPELDMKATVYVIEKN